MPINKRKNLIICKLIADVSWATHYFCLGAYGGIVPNFVGIFRELIFVKREDKKWANSPIIPVIFILINFGLGIFTFKEPINVLPIVASALVTISLWLKKPMLIKITTIPVNIMFLIYNLVVGSYIGAFNETLSMLSIAIYFIKELFKKNEEEKNMSIFSNDIKTDKEIKIIEGGEIKEYSKIISSKVSKEMEDKGEEFAKAVDEGFYSDFEKEGDKMAHVSTFCVLDEIVYMTYYANVKEASEDPNNQTARLVYCPIENPDDKTFIDVQSVGDTCSGERVNLVYDTIFAVVNENTLCILWTAKVGENYYRLYRFFDTVSKTLGEVGVNRFKVGKVINDFSTTGIQTALAENDIGIKKMYSDIGIMQKFTKRREDGEEYYYSGTYSGDFTAIIKSKDLITWEYVSQPDFINGSKWENATYVLGDKCYYYVRQQDDMKYDFLTVYNLKDGSWDKPVLIEDCQSRSDFIEYEGNLYLFHAPIDREHIGVIKIDTTDISKSEKVLQSHIHSSCFYPFIQYFKDRELAMSYTVERKHIRLATFKLSKFL